MVLVGATIVGAIGTQWHGDIQRTRQPQHFRYIDNEPVPIALQKAEEMGYFKLGSTVILLFAEKQHVRWQAGLKSGDKIQFGEAIGSLITG